MVLNLLGDLSVGHLHRDKCPRLVLGLGAETGLDDESALIFQGDRTLWLALGAWLLTCAAGNDQWRSVDCCEWRGVID
jgi:hypothetical protein